MRLARVLGVVGRTLIGVGVLLLLFVAYQLWGTGLQQARAQDRLGDEFEAALESTTTTTTSEVTGTTRTTIPPLPPPPEGGEAMAQLSIPSIGVDEYVVEGVSVGDLKKGPGHYPNTPLPGQAGNAAIAGHRTTYGAPFYDLNELEPGDEIIVRTLQGEFTYVVDGKQVVQPNQTEVLNPTTEARLTLTTCEPRFSARRRLIVTAVLEDEPVPAATTTTTRPQDEVDDEPDEVIAFDDPAGLSGDPAARWPTFWWGLWTTLAAVVIWRVKRLTRRWWVYAAGAPVFLVLLFVFFENVSRLLPANI
jgi:sortase A